jgi:alpha-methylacyl-CoA racemase
MAGPLSGLTIVELAGIGPGPMCSMMLGDMGADVIRVDRTKSHVMDRLADPKYAVHNRSRRSVSVDLQKKEGVDVVLRLIEKADGLTEPFRPGVAERLGLGPDVCLGRNSKLVYGRMTGWGQEGPLAKAAGHDINYIALTGALHAIGSPSRPAIPLNLVGDFGGGSTYLVIGLLAGLLQARASGRGQVVDAAITDGTASLMAMIYGLHAAGAWSDQRSSNLLDGGMPWYDIYETKDGQHVAVGALEEPFYLALLEGLGIAPEDAPRTPQNIPALRERFSAVFATRTRDEWAAIFEGTDACVAPILSMTEAPKHPHNVARQTFIERDGVVQPGPAPRFSATPSVVAGPAAAAGAHTREALSEWGVRDVDRLIAAGVAAQAGPS